MWSKTKLFFSKLIIKIFGDVQFFKQPMFCLLWGDTHYKVKGEEARVILDKLKKGDILLARYDRYVSSWFIPGFYTHVALYIGDKKVIHAVTKGVKEDDILSLLRCDYICVLRPRGVTDEEVNRAVKTAKGFVGLKYDFIFNNETDDRLYCSELVQKAYDERFLSLVGEEIISPDAYREEKMLEPAHESRNWRKLIGKTK
jgi:hypothetical protein